MASKVESPPPARRSLRWLLLMAVILFSAAWVFVMQLASAPHEPSASLGPSIPPTAAPIAGRNTPLPPRQIGIIAGHNRLKTLPNGEVVRDDDPNPVPDPGAICEDGSAMEADITLSVAKRVVSELKQQDKLNVELLGEFDPRLKGYFGAALISVHVDACIKYASGFKVARLLTSAVPETEDRLVECIRERYQAVTNLTEHRNSITPDMQEYHAFREIALTTPGAIIELGFLRDDQSMLKQGDLPVKGVVEGIRCFLKK